MKWAVYECTVEYTGHNAFNPAWKETKLHFATENGL